MECELEEVAAMAFKAALLLRNREEAPELWARNHMRLVSALHGQAIMESDDKAERIFRDAIAAYEAALEVCALEEYDVDLQYCHSGLAGALVYLAEQDLVEDPRNLLERALKSYRSKMRAAEDSSGRESIQDEIDAVQGKLAALTSSIDS